MGCRNRQKVETWWRWQLLWDNLNISRNLLHVFCQKAKCRSNFVSSSITAKRSFLINIAPENYENRFIKSFVLVTRHGFQKNSKNSPGSEEYFHIPIQLYRQYFHEKDNALTTDNSFWPKKRNYRHFWISTKVGVYSFAKQLLFFRRYMRSLVSFVKILYTKVMKKWKKKNRKI